MYEKNIKKLPDAYFKEKSGNNYKLLRLNELSAETFFNDMQDVLNSLDLDIAYGKTLDLYGEMLQILRGSMTDDQYRIALKNKIGENFCQGDINSVLYLLSEIFDCSLSEISITEKRINRVSVKLPMLTNLTSDTVLEMIKRLLPITVTISDIELSGTFEFGEIMQTPLTYENLSKFTCAELEKTAYKDLENYPCERDENAGFGDVEQTMGGFLGLLQQGG